MYASLGLNELNPFDFKHGNLLWVSISYIVVITNRKVHHIRRQSISGGRAARRLANGCREMPDTMAIWRCKMHQLMIYVITCANESPPEKWSPNYMPIFGHWYTYLRLLFPRWLAQLNLNLGVQTGRYQESFIECFPRVILETQTFSN